MITITMVITLMLLIGSPAIYAKKHHRLTDTEKEDSTASDAQGRPCTFGPAHDECFGHVQ